MIFFLFEYVRRDINNLSKSHNNVKTSSYCNNRDRPGFKPRSIDGLCRIPLAIISRKLFPAISIVSQPAQPGYLGDSTVFS
jgi:hypothetical protein